MTLSVAFFQRIEPDKTVRLNCPVPIRTRGPEHREQGGQNRQDKCMYVLHTYTCPVVRLPAPLSVSGHRPSPVNQTIFPLVRLSGCPVAIAV